MQSCWWLLPCQGLLSQGGVRDPGRKINTLYLEFARALPGIRPKAFIVENVSGMVRHNFSHLLKTQIKVFTEAGYRVRAEVLNAADFGVAQERRRIFIVGLRSDLGMDYAFPVPTWRRDSAYDDRSSACQACQIGRRASSMHESSIGTTCLVIGVGIGRCRARRR